METISFDKFESIKPKKIHLAGLLIVGVVLMTLSHLSWNVDILAWLSMVPFLLFLHFTKGIKSRLVFFLVLILAWSLIVFKIITEPIPYFLIPLYSIPIAIIHLPGYLLYDRLKSHKLAVLVFPAMMILMEWIQYTFTPFASWGVAAYTQDDSLNISQSVSVLGIAGLSYLIYWANSSLTSLIVTKKPNYLNSLIPVLTIVLVAIYGHLRLEISKTRATDTLKVAAVGTDSEIGGLPLPDFESNQKVIEKIFERTEKAAHFGAKIIVWNEAAFYLLPENESVWKDSISKLARNLQIALTASYVVPLAESAFRFENKYVLFNPQGEILNEYLKHEPVPGEPAVKGTEEISASTLFESEIGGAICYDYDFPYLAQQNRKAGADIVALPSSDWRGIDPLHTQMASFRAIEQGHSIIRSTRFGLSAAISPYGELISRQSSFNENDKILVADIPAKGIKTIYAKIGDLFVYANIGFILLIVFQLFMGKTTIKKSPQVTR